MISSTSFDGRGKPNPHAANSSDADANLDIFAALFAVPVLAPPIVSLKDLQSKLPRNDVVDGSTLADSYSDNHPDITPSLPPFTTSKQARNISAFDAEALPIPISEAAMSRSEFSRQISQPLFATESNFPTNTNLQDTAQRKGASTGNVTPFSDAVLKGSNTENTDDLLPAQFLAYLGDTSTGNPADEGQGHNNPLLEIPHEIPIGHRRSSENRLDVDIQILEVPDQSIAPGNSGTTLKSALNLLGIKVVNQKPTVSKNEFLFAAADLLEVPSPSPVNISFKLDGLEPPTETTLLEIPDEIAVENKFNNPETPETRSMPPLEVLGIEPAHDDHGPVIPVSEIEHCELPTGIPDKLSPKPEKKEPSLEFLQPAIPCDTPIPAAGGQILATEFPLPKKINSPLDLAAAKTEQTTLMTFEISQSAISIDTPLAAAGGQKLATEFPLPTKINKPLDLTAARTEHSTLLSFERSESSPVSKDVPSIVSSDNNLKTSTAPEVPADQNIVEQIRQLFSASTSQSIDKPMAALARPEKDFKTAESGLALTFDPVAKSAANLSTVFEKAPAEAKLKTMVFDQLEPRLLELSSLAAMPGERRVLKMRLHPADLGTVEITVVKSASGKINAHFQTESPATQQVISDTLTGLRDSLERSGMQVGEIDISCSSFSPGGNDGRGERAKEFGSTDDRGAEALSFDDNPNTEDDQKNRLVNLRA